MTTDIPDLIAGALGVSRGTAYDLMREALAEASPPDPCCWPGTSCDAQQEPYAWMHTKIDDVFIRHRPADLRRHPDRWMALYKDPTPCQTCEALARTVMMDQTAHDIPPAREPLTDERILSCPYDNSDMRSAFSEGWLKAEAAHGITKGNT